MDESFQSPKKKSVLADHKRIGKRFIPPMAQGQHEIRETKWVDTPLPELLWLALLNEKHGLARGAELAVQIARAGVIALATKKKTWFGATSAFAKLSHEQQKAVTSALDHSGVLQDVRVALATLCTLYPQCPFTFLYEDHLTQYQSHADLSRLKSLLGLLFNKTSTPAILMQANGVYIAFATDMLLVAPGMSLAQFEEISKYPHTELSKAVAGSIMALIIGFFGSLHTEYSDWPSYFWNRGLLIDACSIELDVTHE